MNSANQFTLDSEQDLLEAASQGSLEAFNQLVLHNQDAAYRYAYAVLGDTVLAEDVTQESFIKAFRQIRTFRGGYFRAWLLRIVKNTAYDLVRQSRRRPVQPLFSEDEYGQENESPGWLADPQAWVDVAVEQLEDSRRLYGLLDELPESFRSVLTLVDINELAYGEVAHILSVPLGTVKSRLARARLMMRQKLIENFDSFHHFDLPATFSQPQNIDV